MSDAARTWMNGSTGPVSPEWRMSVMDELRKRMTMATSVMARVEEKLEAVRRQGRRPLRIELGQQEYRALQDELSPIPNISVPVLLGVRVTQVKSPRRVAVVAGEKPVTVKKRVVKAA